MRLIPRILTTVCLMTVASTAAFGQANPLPPAPLPRPLSTQDQAARPQYASPAAYVASPGYAVMPSSQAIAAPQVAPQATQATQPTYVAPAPPLSPSAYTAPAYAAPAQMRTQPLPTVNPPSRYPPAACPDHCGQPSRNRIQQRWDTQILPDLQASHWGFPDRFETPAFGSSLNRHFNIQIANGQESLLTLYYYDFQNGAGQNRSRINATGQRQLQRFAPRLLSGSTPLRIQPTPNNPQLDEARKREVIATLEYMVPGGSFAQRVIIADPGTIGMGGEESMLIHEGFIAQPRMPAPTLGGADFGAN
jgi:hypothetical protein